MVTRSLRCAASVVAGAVIIVASAAMARAGDGAAGATPADDLERLSIEQLVARLAARVGPAVVAILPARKEGDEGLTFRERWWRDRGGMPGSRGGGDWDGPFNSGVIIDATLPEGVAGHPILTTAGALKKGETKARVILADGRELDARLLGRDERMDLALLAVDAPVALPPGLALSTDDARPGDMVFCFGNVFESVTRDRVAAMGRGIVTGIFPMPRESGRTLGRYRFRAIETDAAVNPGSFGGPLVDRRGRAVGIVTSTWVAGRRLAVAVPSREVALAIPALARGEVPRAFAGIGVVEEAGRGLVIVEVLADGPAAALGIPVGAVLRELDGRRLRFMDELEEALEWLAPGGKTTIVIDDGKGERRIDLPLGIRGEPAPANEAPKGEDPPSGEGAGEDGEDGEEGGGR